MAESAADAEKRHGPLDVSLSIGGQHLVLGSKGTWLSDSAPVVKETNVQAYLDRVEKVEAEAGTLLAKTLKLEEQRQLLEFKNRVLTEMLAVSQLDSQKAMAELKRERLKVEALKWELAHVAMRDAES